MTTPHKEITSGLKFPEGPVVMPDGSVILVEIMGQRLTRVYPDGRKETVAQLQGMPDELLIAPSTQASASSVPPPAMATASLASSSAWDQV